jgi:hypothetical protein
VGIGLFLILLGVALLVATNDLLGLGSVREYFTWQSAMVFIGALMMLNLNFVGGILLAAGGVWFWIDDYYGRIPELLKMVYWPSVIILTGLLIIFSSLIKRTKKQINRETN